MMMMMIMMMMMLMMINDGDVMMMMKVMMEMTMMMMMMMMIVFSSRQSMMMMAMPDMSDVCLISQFPYCNALDTKHEISRGNHLCFMLNSSAPMSSSFYKSSSSSSQYGLHFLPVCPAQFHCLMSKQRNLLQMKLPMRGWMRKYETASANKFENVERVIQKSRWIDFWEIY